MPKDMRTYRGYGNRRYSKRTTFIICLSIALVVTAAVLAAVALGGGLPSAGKPLAVTLGESYDAAAVAGQLTEAPVGDLNPPDAFNYRINQKITVSKGQANLRIENPTENQLLLRVALTLDDGTLLYQSGFIKPYHYIESARLDVSLQAGTYAATASLEAYDPVSWQLLSTAQQPVEITVA